MIVEIPDDEVMTDPGTPGHIMVSGGRGPYRVVGFDHEVMVGRPALAVVLNYAYNHMAHAPDSELMSAMVALSEEMRK